VCIAQNRGDIGMPEQFPHGIKINARLHQADGKVVSKIVKPKIREAGRGSQTTPRRVDGR
jgi:hypothetical protein